MSADALKTKLDQYLRPENVEDLCTPKFNPLIWNQLSASMRTQGVPLKKKPSMLVGSSIAKAKVADIASSRRLVSWAQRNKGRANKK